MSKNTAVEWLVTELRNRIAEGTLDAIAISKLKMEAKTMEREQMAESFCEGSKLIECPNELSALFEFQLYYTETYKGGSNE